MTKTQTLYRMFSADDELLYVGITQQQVVRFYQHAREKPWWPEVARIRLQHYPDREAVEKAELRAIREECPRYNVVGKKQTKARSPQRKKLHDALGFGPERSTGWRPESMTCTLHRTGGSFRSYREPLVLWWELDYETITDNYLPDEIDAFDLFDIWRNRIKSSWSRQLPIWWFVVGPTTCEYATPSTEWPDSPHFHKYFMLGDSSGRYRMELDALPVASKKWTIGQADKGGFIQEATGWQPYPLQPSVEFRFLHRRMLARRG